jgi:hypothetical protein
MNLFTYQNTGSQEKVTINVDRIVKVTWNDGEKKAWIYLDGGIQAFLEGDENKTNFCRALGWDV